MLRDFNIIYFGVFEIHTTLTRVSIVINLIQVW